MKELAAEIARAMAATRAATLELFDTTREDDLRESPGFGFRPIIWHLAHIGVFEGYWLLQKLRDEPPLDERYERVFDPIQTPREESKNLPSRREMEEYLARVRERSLRNLAECDFGSDDPLLRDAYAFRLVLEHERQHQETLAYLLQLLDPAKKTRPGATVVNLQPTADPSSLAPTLPAPEMIEVPAGPFMMGAAWDTFAYDNEYPAHTISLPAFKIARLPVTNEAFAEFVAAGGYDRREFWSEEGWQHRERESWAHPLYWRREDAQGWHEQTMFDSAPLKLDHPVTGISFHEAEAYARFRGKRLPTEPEWEKAASHDGRHGDNADHAHHKRRFAWGDTEPSDALANYGLRRWATTPVGHFPAGASHHGCLDMTGNVWEWTSTPFDAFPGFQPFPYPEYSQVWFDGDHRVLKGGSWATHPSVLRTSFRNFFRRPFRIAFAGLRLAEDA